MHKTHRPVQNAKIAEKENSALQAARELVERLSAFLEGRSAVCPYCGQRVESTSRAGTLMRLKPCGCRLR